MKTKLKILGVIMVLCVASIFYFRLVSNADFSFGKTLITIKSKILKKEELSLNQKVSSNQILLQNLETGEVLLERNSHKKVPIASLTKIMTTYILLEEAKSENETVLLSQDILNQLASEQASLAGFQANDEISVLDLAYGIILPSGGEAAMMAAEHISGNEQNFVKLMNGYAQKLGMKETKFKTATGLDTVQQYSTVHDLSLLIRSAMKNESFEQVFTSFEHQTAPTKSAPEGYHLKHTLLREDNELIFENGQLLGGKTGYTKKAGLCLASVAEIAGENYLLITTGAKGGPLGEQFNVTDAKLIYEAIETS